MNQVDMRQACLADVSFIFSKRGDRVSVRVIERASGGQKMGRSLACEGRRISDCHLSPAKITPVAKWGREGEKRGKEQGVGKKAFICCPTPSPYSLFFRCIKGQIKENPQSRVGSHASTNDVKIFHTKHH